MTRHALNRSILAPAAALLVLCALLACFYPRSALAVLSGGEGADPKGLTVFTGGEPHAYSPDTERALLAALADSVCVRLPGLPHSSKAGDICLSYGEMRAFFSPRGAYLRSAGGGAAYLIMGSGPELYQRVQRLVSLRT